METWRDFKPRCLTPTAKFGGGLVTIWGCFSKTGIGQIRLCEVDESSHVQGYPGRKLASFCSDSVAQLWELFFPAGNAPCHTAGSIKMWMKDHQINRTVNIDKRVRARNDITKGKAKQWERGEWGEQSCMGMVRESENPLRSCHNEGGCLLFVRNSMCCSIREHPPPNFSREPVAYVSAERQRTAWTGCQAISEHSVIHSHICSGFLFAR